MNILLKRVDGKWDTIDEYTLANRSKAIDSNGRPVYEDTYVSLLDDGNVTFNGTFTMNDIGIVCRFFSVDTPKGIHSQIYAPDFVLFKSRGKSHILRNLQTGQQFKEIPNGQSHQSQTPE